jgi:hypothetical protein
MNSASDAVVRRYETNGKRGRFGRRPSRRSIESVSKVLAQDTENHH